MKLKLIDKKIVAENTKSFYFEPEKPMKWLPGQFFYFTIPNLKYPDPRGNTRHFTISTSPTEGNILCLTTRMRESGYKKNLDELEIGSLIEGDGPDGTFILDENEKGNHVLLAGGVGITPFRSFIKYNLDKNLKDIHIHLIYSNSVPEEIAFRKELESLKSETIKIDFTITKPENSKEKWSGLTGRINQEMILKLTSYMKNPTFWICGPSAMVEAMEEVLINMKVGADKIRVEKFTGY